MVLKQYHDELPQSMMEEPDNMGVVGFGSSYKIININNYYDMVS